MDTTRPVGPTSWAVSMVTSPMPQPISNTRIPDAIPALRRKASVKGAKKAGLLDQAQLLAIIMAQNVIQRFQCHLLPPKDT